MIFFSFAAFTRTVQKIDLSMFLLCYQAYVYFWVIISVTRDLIIQLHVYIELSLHVHVRINDDDDDDDDDIVMHTVYIHLFFSLLLLRCSSHNSAFISLFVHSFIYSPTAQKYLVHNMHIKQKETLKYTNSKT